MHTPNIATFGGKYFAASPPAKAPSAVPMNRSLETFSAAPSDDCVMTRVVIGAHQVPGSRNNRATSSEITAATAVRSECTSTGHQVNLNLSLAIPSRWWGIRSIR